MPESVKTRTSTLGFTGYLEQGVIFLLYMYSDLDPMPGPSFSICHCHNLYL